MKKDFTHYSELALLKFIVIAFLVIVACFAMVGCSSIESATKRICKVECDDCKSVKVECSQTVDKDGQKITPAGT